MLGEWKLPDHDDIRAFLERPKAEAPKTRLVGLLTSQPALYCCNTFLRLVAFAHMHPAYQVGMQRTIED